MNDIFCKIFVVFVVIFVDEKCLYICLARAVVVLYGMYLCPLMCNFNRRYSPHHKHFTNTTTILLLAMFWSVIT